MKIDLLDNGCLKILLTEEDMHDFSLSFEEMDYSNENTRNALHHILDNARREVGFDTSNSLMIEAIPVDGGCLLLLTPTGGKRHVRMKRVVGPYIFELDDVDTVLHLAKSVGGNTPPMFGSSLYRFDKRYRLIIYPGVPLSREMDSLFNEFGRPAGEGDIAVAYTAEHGESISVGDALGRLSAAMNPGKGGRFSH
ncbi:MAG: adaptor protein MecA [Oscillospiraceae bacterium]|nr:adaptor protein MecA [Oscillospiraceae bacterium]